MTKSKINNWAREWNIDEEALDELLEILKSNKSTRGQKNPSYEENGIIYHWCRWSQNYWPEADMVISKGKSKGYSKIAYSLWTRINREIKNQESIIAKASIKGEYQPDMGVILNRLKEALNNPSSYDYDYLLKVKDLKVKAKWDKIIWSLKNGYDPYESQSTEDEPKSDEPNFESDDPYDVLGVNRDMSLKEIKAVWRRLASQYHPDNQEFGDELKAKIINEAWDFIKRNH